MLLALVLAVAGDAPLPCDAPLPRVHATVVAKPEARVAFESCFGTSTAPRPDDEYEVVGRIVKLTPGRFEARVLISLTPKDAELALVAPPRPFEAHVDDGDAAAVNAMLLRGRDFIRVARGDIPDPRLAAARERAWVEAEQALTREQRATRDRQRQAALQGVVLVVDATRTLPPPARAALDLVLADLRRGGITLLEDADAPGRASEPPKRQVLVLTATIKAPDEPLPQDEQSVLASSGTHRFDVIVDLLVRDGDVTVNRETFVLRVLGINVDKAMVEFVARDARDELEGKSTQVRRHTDRLIEGVIAHLKHPTPHIDGRARSPSPP